MRSALVRPSATSAKGVWPAVCVGRRSMSISSQSFLSIAQCVFALSFSLRTSLFYFACLVRSPMVSSNARVHPSFIFALESSHSNASTPSSASCRASPFCCTLKSFSFFFLSAKAGSNRTTAALLCFLFAFFYSISTCHTQNPPPPPEMS